MEKKRRQAVAIPRAAVGDVLCPLSSHCSSAAASSSFSLSLSLSSFLRLLFNHYSHSFVFAMSRLPSDIENVLLYNYQLSSMYYNYFKMQIFLDSNHYILPSLSVSPSLLSSLRYDIFMFGLFSFYPWNFQ